MTQSAAMMAMKALRHPPTDVTASTMAPVNRAAPLEVVLLLPVPTYGDMAVAAV